MSNPSNMVEMVSLRTFRLATKSGHVVQFEAKVPKMVHKDAVPEAMKYGCVPTGGAEEAAFHEDLGRVKVEFTGDIRRSTIYLAIEAIVKQNKTTDFDGAGVPKHTVISDRVGFDVAKQEAVDVYQMFTAARSEGRELGLHPQALNVLKVVEATDKAELVELAAEFGVPADKAKGLDVKTLRKMLLTKLNGVAAD